MPLKCLSMGNRLPRQQDSIHCQVLLSSRAMYSLRPALYAALGGDKLRERIEREPDQLLFSICWMNAPARCRGNLPCSRTGGFSSSSLLACALSPPAWLPRSHSHRCSLSHWQPIRWSIATDTRESYRLDLDNELRAIRRTLADSGCALNARRIPPTAADLRRALRFGPALLHLTCYGNVITIDDKPMAMLSFEDRDGKLDIYKGSDLITLPPRGVLRGVLLSACKTAVSAVGSRIDPIATLQTRISLMRSY